MAFDPYQDEMLLPPSMRRKKPSPFDQPAMAPRRPERSPLLFQHMAFQGNQQGLTDRAMGMLPAAGKTVSAWQAANDPYASDADKQAAYADAAGSAAAGLGGLGGGVWGKARKGIQAGLEAYSRIKQKRAKQDATSERLQLSPQEQEAYKRMIDLGASHEMAMAQIQRARSQDVMSQYRMGEIQSGGMSPEVVAPVMGQGFGAEPGYNVSDMGFGGAAFT